LKSIDIWVNDISYQNHSLNMVELKEMKDDEEKNFVFLSSIRIMSSNVVEICRFGRKRWKIENEGFKK